MDAHILCSPETILQNANDAHFRGTEVPVCEDCCIVLQNNALEILKASSESHATAIAAFRATPSSMAKVSSSIEHASLPNKQAPEFPETWNEKMLPRLLPDNYESNPCGGQAPVRVR